MVARALWAALGAGRRAFLDTRVAVGEALPERFPTAFEACRRYGIDPRRQPIPVAPAAHYHMGGIDVDLDGRTSLDGLWAAGEVACTGAHGANRLASNSLLEGLVFGERVAESVREALTQLPPRSLARSEWPTAPGADTAQDPAAVELEVRRLMWENVGLVRSRDGLRAALARFDALTEQRLQGPSRSLVTVARLVATAALARTESRGAHFRSDHPATDPAWRRRILLSPNGPDIRLETQAVAEPEAVEACA